MQALSEVLPKVVTTVSVGLQEDRASVLEECDRNIRQYSREADEYLRKGIEKTLAIGQELRRAQKQFKETEGEFLSWLNTRNYEWGVRTSYNLIQVAERFGDVPVEQLSLIKKSALYLLASHPEAATAALEVAAEGQAVGVQDAKNLIEQQSLPKVTIEDVRAAIAPWWEVESAANAKYKNQIELICRIPGRHKSLFPYSPAKALEWWEREGREQTEQAVAWLDSDSSSTTSCSTCRHCNKIPLSDRSKCGARAFEFDNEEDPGVSCRLWKSVQEAPRPTIQVQQPAARTVFQERIELPSNRPTIQVQQPAARTVFQERIELPSNPSAATASGSQSTDRQRSAGDLGSCLSVVGSPQFVSYIPAKFAVWKTGGQQFECRAIGRDGDSTLIQSTERRLAVPTAEIELLEAIPLDSIDISSRQWGLLCDRAHESGVSTADVVRQAIAAYLGF